MEPLDRRLLLTGMGIAGVAAISRLAKGGPLDPPAGSVVSTGKTLQEVYDKTARTDLGFAEPRTPVQSLAGSAAALHVITQPGSYYLTGNILGVPGKSGIEIAADSITLDLRGFSLVGVSGSASAITSLASYQRFVLRNGTLHGWGQHGLDGNSLYSCLVEEVRASFNGSNGLRVAGSSVVRNSQANNNATGMSLGNGCACATCYCGSNDTGINAQDHSSVQASDMQFNNTGIVGNRFCTVERCTFRGGSLGLRLTDEASAIGNTFAYMATAISLTGSGCFVVQNTARGSSYSMGSGNTYGPIVSAIGIGALGTAGNQNHPWANFLF